MFKEVLAGCLLYASSQAVFSASPERSVIQIGTFSQEPVWDAPWRFNPVSRSSGSGFVIKGKRIMTNAHVVSWARQVLVRRFQDPKPYLAKVTYAGHDCDLAILEPVDESFFDGLEPLEIGDLPQVRSTVVTYGYPAGGEQISYTRGVVSRIELQTYVQIGNRSHLSVQTDAAINPGNSGGPVIQDDKVVGVSFQGLSGLENAGFFIPTTIVNHFLKDIEDGKYDGFPQAGIYVIPLQNSAYRRYLKLPDNDLGARIDYILDIPTSRELLRVDDVILKVGPYQVGSDGTVLYQGNRVSLSVGFSEYQTGEKVPLKIWRDGQELDISVPIYVYTKDRSQGNQYDILPRYYIHAGLVFVPLSLDYLRTLRAGYSDPANAPLRYELQLRQRESPETAREEPVVLASVLAHSVNANFNVRARALVDKINGVRIEKLEDVARAFAADSGQQEHLIEFHPDHSIEAINKEAAAQASDEILKTYGVPKDRRL